MRPLQLTNKTISNLQPKSTPVFIRDSILKGFGVRVNPSGQIKYIVEVRHNGKSFRKTIGDKNLLLPQDARREAISLIADIKSGAYEIKQKDISLGRLLALYISDDRLKPGTIRDYREAVNFYLQDWLKMPVSTITKEKVERRFYKIKDKGVHGGKPTYSQAAKVMRILSALMNYARADELIENNPVDVLKLKRVGMSTRKRDNFLKTEDVRRLLQATVHETHPMTLAIHLMLYTGLRRNEALRLQWNDVQEVNGVLCLLIRDTKNSRPHYVPVTQAIQTILKKAGNESAYIFPSPFKKDDCIHDARSTINRICKTLDITFTCHDLRRTFATRAMEVGIDHMMIKRMLNHKTNDITAQYIQWHSRENLEVMRKALETVVY
jgi:integrase